MNEQQQEQEKTERITFEKWGKEFAQSTNCNPEAINNGLNGVYNDFLKKQKLDKDAVKRKIEKIKEEIESLNKNSEDKKANNKELEIEIKKLNEDIELRKEEILDLENEILGITEGKGPEPDKTKLNLYGAFALFAFIGTILMYMATFGTALLGLEEDDFIIRANVFGDLVETGAGIFIFSAFISIIPIVCGYFYQKSLKENKIVIAYSTLLIVLILDVVIGYLLAKTIYEGEFMRGLHTEPWEFSKVFTDVQFYIVLVINFAMYMTFSKLAQAFFEEQERLTPNAKVAQLKNKIDNLKKIIEELKDKITENEKKIEINESEIEKNNISIKKKKDDIEDYELGKIPVNTDYLKDLIAQFLKGYQAYTNMMIDNEEKAKSIINKVLQNAENWFKNKEDNGWRNDEISTSKSFFNIGNN